MFSQHHFRSFCLLCAGGIASTQAAAEISPVSPSVDIGSEYEWVSLPNMAGSTITIPSAWGAYDNMVYAGVGITKPQAHTNQDDSAVFFGVGLGDPYDTVGVQLGVAVNDVSEFDNPSFNILLHRYIADGTSVAIGGEHLFPDDQSDATESYFMVFSQAVQAYPSKYDEARTRLQYSIGIGKGRFSEKSPLDIAAGHGDRGTFVFGSVAYEIYRATNLIAEWNGVNLNAGVSLAPFEYFATDRRSQGLLSQLHPVITLGVADLADTSGDGARFVASASLSYHF